MKPIAILATLALAAGCASSAGNRVASASTALAGEPAPGPVDAAQARRLIAAGVTVVDVRTPEEYAAGHVPGAINIPHDQMATRLGEIGSPSTPVLLYCRSGRRSGLAAGTLAEKGFTSVWDMKTYQAWLDSEPAVGSAGH